MSNGGMERDPAAQLAEAEQKGFIRGLNVGFVSIGALAAAAVAWRSLFDAPKFEELFRQVKVPMPGLTLLALQAGKPAAILFLILAAIGIWATRSRGHHRGTLVLNALLFGGALFWLMFISVALSLPFHFLVEGIAPGRP